MRKPCSIRFVEKYKCVTGFVIDKNDVSFQQVKEIIHKWIEWADENLKHTEVYEQFIFLVNPPEEMTIPCMLKKKIILMEASSLVMERRSVYHGWTELFWVFWLITGIPVMLYAVQGCEHDEEGKILKQSYDFYGIKQFLPELINELNEQKKLLDSGLNDKTEWHPDFDLPITDKANFLYIVHSGGDHFYSARPKLSLNTAVEQNVQRYKAFLWDIDRLFVDSDNIQTGNQTMMTSIKPDNQIRCLLNTMKTG